MRVTSSLWVGAYIRRCNAEGTPAVVEQRGAEEAGAIFIVIDRLDGTADLYGPAPQAMFEEARPSERMFQQIEQAAASDVISVRLASEKRFDPDIWIVTVEDREGRSRVDAV